MPRGQQRKPNVRRGDNVELERELREAKEEIRRLELALKDAQAENNRLNAELRKWEETRDRMNKRIEDAGQRLAKQKAAKHTKPTKEEIRDLERRLNDMLNPR